MFSEDRPVGNPAQIFRSFLKNKGLRNTPQRQQIMEVFFNESGHLTTEEIYDRVRKEDPSLGQGITERSGIYRTSHPTDRPIRIQSRKRGASYERSLGTIKF